MRREPAIVRQRFIMDTTAITGSTNENHHDDNTFIERVNIMADEETISSETVAFYLGNAPEEESDPSFLKDFKDMKLSEARNFFEELLLTSKLKANGYNISKTAAALGIYPSNLHGKIKKFGIEMKR